MDMRNLEKFMETIRVYSISGKEFLRNEDGSLRGIKTVEVDITSRSS